MSELVIMPEWYTLETVAKRLSDKTGKEVTREDVLRLCLEGKIKLSVWLDSRPVRDLIQGEPDTTTVFLQTGLCEIKEITNDLYASLMKLVLGKEPAFVPCDWLVIAQDGTVSTPVYQLEQLKPHYSISSGLPPNWDELAITEKHILDYEKTIGLSLYGKDTGLDFGENQLTDLGWKDLFISPPKRSSKIFEHICGVVDNYILQFSELPPSFYALWEYIRKNDELYVPAKQAIVGISSSPVIKDNLRRRCKEWTNNSGSLWGR